MTEFHIKDKDYIEYNIKSTIQQQQKMNDQEREALKELTYDQLILSFELENKKAEEKGDCTVFECRFGNEEEPECPDCWDANVVRSAYLKEMKDRGISEIPEDFFLVGQEFLDYWDEGENYHRLAELVELIGAENLDEETIVKAGRSN
jgi:hypothetical protein